MKVLPKVVRDLVSKHENEVREALKELREGDRENVVVKGPHPDVTIHRVKPAG